MNKLQKKIKRFQIKLQNWEYWPIWLVYLPVSFYYVYLALKAKSFFFFSASNPSIENGGMFFESKWKIFKLIPTEFYPKTIYISENENLEEIIEKIKVSNLNFPIIAKPDRGERGLGVKKIGDFDELTSYVNLVKVPFLVQDYIDFPLELSVFYYRLPNEKKGQLFSVALKDLLSVEGNGISTLLELIYQKDRAFLQLEKLKKNAQLNFNEILKKGEIKVIVPYGNHSLGATFLNYNHLIDENLTEIFDFISQQIEGFYFGRFDLRCTSLEDLKNGKNISILELNGAGAEPAHIYNPNFPFFNAQKALATYFQKMNQIAIQNNKNGIPFMSFKEFIKIRKSEKEFKQRINL